ncbi:MAG TPA: ABC transporter permease [Ktedonobacteraceae bacterium]|nr:ABC transporter permease [Ktedonobacteraceae bacterium]
MGQYLIRRLLQAIPLLILVSILMFVLLHLLPGGPEAVYDNPELDEAGRAALRASFGLNDPLPIQYLKWIGNALRGNFGVSYATNQAVTDILSQRFPATLELFLSAFALAFIVALILGTASAVRQGTTVDYTITTLAYFGISMPIFLFGLFMQDIFGVSLHWLPTSGTVTLGYIFDPFNAFLDHFLHLVMPMTVLALTFTARWSRYLRAGMIEVTKQDYMRTARAKGVSPGQILLRHALRNAIIPLITVVAIDFGSIAGGATITEGVFNWPGMGLLFINSLEKRDYPVLLTTLLLGAILVIIFNLVADILYGVMDPRIRYS